MLGAEQAIYNYMLESWVRIIIDLVFEYRYYILAFIIILITQKLVRNKIAENMAILELTEENELQHRVYTPNEAEEERIVSLIKAKDPNFDKDMFEKFVQDIFTRFSNAYCKNELDSVRKYVDMNIIERFKLQIYQKNAAEQKDYLEILKYNFVDFFGYHNEGENEIISVATNVIMLEYTKDKDGNIVIGSEKEKKKITFILSFARKTGGQTINNIKDYKDGVAHCPNCGGAIVNSFSECEHCGTVLFNSTENWLLNHIETL